MASATCSFSYLLPVAEGHRCVAHRHPVTEIVYSERARGTLFQAGERYAYADGSVIVYQPGMTHWVENVGPGWHICLGIEGCGARGIQAGCFLADEALTRRFAEARAAMERSGPLSAQTLDLLAGLIALQLRERVGEADSLSPAQQVRETIDGAFQEPWSVEKLAQSVYLSPDYLRHAFRHEFGESPQRYLTRRRMEYAISLLLTTAEPIQRIGASCGFPDAYYFSRAFKKWTGFSPTDFRQQKRRE